MSLRNVLTTMMYRRGNIAGSLVSQTIAVAVMFALMMLGHSAMGGPGTTYRYAGADAVVAVDAASYFDVSWDNAPERFRVPLTDDVLVEIGQINGVAEVIPDRTFSLAVLDSDGDPISIAGHGNVIGGGWSTATPAEFSLVEGSAPARTGDVVIDVQLAQTAHLTPGSPIALSLNGSVQRFTVTGIASVPNRDALPRQTSVFFTDDEAASLMPSAPANAASVIYASGADTEAVNRGLRNLAEPHKLNVFHGDDRGKIDQSAGSDEIRGIGILFWMMATFVGIIAVFVISSTFGFAILQREREIATQRAIGYTPRQIRVLISVEALVLGAIGAIGGAILGYPLALAFAAMMKSWDRVPGEFHVTLWPLGLGIVILASLLITQCAVFAAARRAANTEPTIAMRQSVTVQRWWSPGKIITGVLCIGLAVAGAIVSPGLDVEAAVGVSLGIALLLAFGLAALSPVLVYGIASLLLVISPRKQGAVARLALRNARARAARVGATISPTIIAISLATMIACFNQTLESGTRVGSSRAMTADLYVTSVDGHIPEGAVAQIEALDGVSLVSPEVTFDVVNVARTDDSRAVDWSVTAIDPATWLETRDIDIDSGEWSAFVPGTVAISKSEATIWGIHAGDSVTVTMPDMVEMQMPVAAVTDDAFSSTSLLMTLEDARPHLATAGSSDLAIILDEGAQSGAVAEEINVIGSGQYALGVVPKSDLVEGAAAGVRENAWASNLLIGAPAAIAALAVANTIVMSTLERKREFSLLRFVGAESRHVLRLVRAESLLTAALAVALGAGTGIFATACTSIGLVGDLSSLTVPVWLIAGYAVVALIVVVVAADLPTRQTLRADLAEEIGRRE